MLKSAIRYVRRQPKQVRDGYALGVAVLFTAVVVAVWSVNLPDRLNSIAGSVEAEENVARPFSSLWSGFKDRAESLRGAFSDVTADLTPTTTTSSTAVSGEIVLTPEEIEALRVRASTDSYAQENQATSAPAISIRIATTTSSTSLPKTATTTTENVLY